MKSFAIIVFFLLAAIGCQKPAEIVAHRIPKSRSDLDKFDRAVRVPQNESLAVPTRMVVGWVDRSKANQTQAVWFFKIKGPVDQVNLTEPMWREFLANLKYDKDGQPEWELPVGWSMGRGHAMRFATLNLNEAVPPLEMSISSLGPNQDLLGNVNRWRRQMGLEAIGKEQIKMADFEYRGGKMLLFDEVGLASPGAGGPMMGAPPLVASAPTTDSPQFRFDPLAGWETGASSTLVKVRLLKKDGDEQAQITVVAMPASANDWPSNVARWAREIGMSELVAGDAESLTSTLQVDGHQAQQLRLIEDDEKYESATVAVMLKRGQSAWFLKLSGDKSVVKNVEHEFKTFLTTFTFQDEN